MPSSVEKTMNGDQLDIGIKTAGRVRNKATSKMDHIRTLETSIMEYKKDANDKNWSNIDKSLQVGPLYKIEKVVLIFNIAVYNIMTDTNVAHQFSFVLGFGKTFKWKITLLWSNAINGSTMDINGKC